MERRSEAFKLDNLPKTLFVRMQYEVEHEGKACKGDEILRLVFAEESLDQLD